jgi:hypothetical protein
MSNRVTQSVTCPWCGDKAKAIVTIAPANGRRARSSVTVKNYSCPNGDFPADTTVLRTLGYP